VSTGPNPYQRPIPASPFVDDDGSPSTELAAALLGLSNGKADATVVMTALARSRLLAPIVAILESTDVDAAGHGVEKDSAMATVLVQGPGGERAMLAFTSVESLQRWRVDARPAPVSGIGAAQTALAEGAETLLVDIEGPIPFAIGGGDLRALARSTDTATLRGRLSQLLGDLPDLTDAYFDSSVSGAPSRLTLVLEANLPETAYRAVLDEVSGRMTGDPLIAQSLSSGVTLTVATPDFFTDTLSLLHRSQL
jgi:hypothetical protein